jgi:hypothetical protein
MYLTYYCLLPREQMTNRLQRRLFFTYRDAAGMGRLFSFQIVINCHFRELPLPLFSNFLFTFLFSIKNFFIIFIYFSSRVPTKSIEGRHMYLLLPQDCILHQLVFTQLQ